MQTVSIYVSVSIMCIDMSLWTPEIGGVQMKHDHSREGRAPKLLQLHDASDTRERYEGLQTFTDARIVTLTCSNPLIIDSYC